MLDQRVDSLISKLKRQGPASALKDPARSLKDPASFLKDPARGLKGGENDFHSQ